ncbi:MAG: DNA polymerase III subunit beta [Verrucomicrobiota bacterium]|nr:DNA polymerase III subunit beta [Verrucomicrobiota bacterium]
MKVVISKLDLVEIIGRIQNIVPTKPTSPILGNVLCEAIDDQLVISATDLMVSMRCFVDAKVIEEGAIALPARRFFQLIRELTAPQVKIHALTHESAEITTGSSLFKIHGMNREEFPQLPDLAESFEFHLQKKVLKEMLSKTAFAAAKEDNRFALNSLRIYIAEQKVTCVATDGKRLAKIVIPVEHLDPLVRGSYLLPLKAVDEMLKMVDDTENPVTLKFARDKISVEAGTIALISKLLAGQYPDVERVIPRAIARECSVHREEWIALLRQISLFTSETSGSVRCTLETGQLHLTAMSSEIGEGRVSMPVDYAGDKLEIAFNPFLLVDILRHSKDETVRLGLIDSHNPGVITDSSAALFVLMPMRLTELPSAQPPAALAIE